MMVSEYTIDKLKQIARNGSCLGIKCSCCPISAECSHKNGYDSPLSNNKRVAARKLSELTLAMLEDALMEGDSGD